MSETRDDLREALARAATVLICKGACLIPSMCAMCDARKQQAIKALSAQIEPILAQVSALQAEVEAKHAELLKLAELYDAEDKRVDAEIRRLEAEVERLQKVEGEREKGRDPKGSGSRPSDQAPAGLAPSGFDPSRMALVSSLQRLSDRAYPGIWDRHWDQDYDSIIGNSGTIGLEPPWNGGDIICEMPSEGEDSRRHWNANASFIVVLVNAYRCGLLVVAPCDRSGAADETRRGSAEGESTVTGTARQAPIPHPLHTHPNPKREDR